MLIDRYADQVRYVILPLVWRDELQVGFGPRPSARLRNANVILPDGRQCECQPIVVAGLRNARAKGKRIGRPRVAVDGIAVLRNRGASWAIVCQETELSKGTAQRALHGLAKNDLRFSATAAG